MTKSPFLCLALFLLLAQAASRAAAETISENIVFLEKTGTACLLYKTNRSNYPHYSIYFKKEAGMANPEDHFADYLYVYPNTYAWDTQREAGFDLFNIEQGSYATLSRLDLGPQLQISKEGRYTFNSWDGISKTPDGHYGAWNAPDNFHQYAYVWVVPENFEVLTYSCNRPGEWVQRHNTLAYYGKNVNDLTFTITYQPRLQHTFNTLSERLKDERQIAVANQHDGIKLTLEETVLFPSGSSELSAKGRVVLDKVAEILANREGETIIIAGHTDNIPITGQLAKTYATNWELAAARSLAVVHYFIDQGVAADRLESRSYGAQRPRASNETGAGRAKNRRIEIMVIKKTAEEDD